MKTTQALQQHYNAQSVAQARKVAAAAEAVLASLGLKRAA